MKKSIYSCLAMFCFIQAQAQEVAVNNSIANGEQQTLLKPDVTTQLKYFAGKEINDTTYLTWKVQDMKHNGEFIIYRSDDGNNFKAIGTKEAIGTPVHSEIAYYMVDTHAVGGMKYYRIVYISTTSEYLLSDKLLLNEDGRKPFAEVAEWQATK